LAKICYIKVNKRLGPNRIPYSFEQVKGRVERLKENYNDFTKLIGGSVGTGFGWDAATNTVVGDEVQ
jgi:hypothetical protein